MGLVHPLAHVECEIGERTQVWQFASVIRSAKIGADCNIGGCSVVDGAVVGDRCSIGHGAQLHPGTVLGHDVFVGPGAIVCNDRWPRTAKDGFDIDRLRSTPAVIVGDGASIGAGALIMPGVMIGERALIAAGAVVGKDVPAGHLFNRDGSISEIRGKPARMRFCSAS